MRNHFRRPRCDRGARHRRQAGFTLVELLLVMMILVALAAVVIPKFRGRSEQAKETQAIMQISSFETVLDAFEVDNGYYPEGEEGLWDLVEQPEDADNWRGPYLDEVPLDPWSEEYIYEYPGKYNESGYDLVSMGPDRREGTEDDVTNWSEYQE
jgi:general secretion pathway protein G